MPNIIIIEKSGSTKEQNIKEFVESDLYKKVGHKTSTGFAKHAIWKVEIDQMKYTIEVYGKTTGRANQENKYDFPPPIDNTLFFGSCAIINKTDANEIANLTNKEWKTIYEKLFGGFEYIGSEDSEDEDEEEEDEEEVSRTKDGYVKDGFIVDDDDEEEEDEDEYDEEEEEEEEEEDEDDEDEDLCKIKRKKNAKTQSLKATKKASKLSKLTKRSRNIKAALAETSTVVLQETFLDCTSELVEEEYL